MKIENTTIGFIGQGWIGKHYADDFESRGYKTVRYALEEPYCQNEKAIADCELTFIAVPTPTTPNGFDDSVLREVLHLIGKGNIAVIKSTTVPGTVTRLQAEFPDSIILHSPEFLTERTAAYDAANPERNIVGIPKSGAQHHKAAKKALAVLPKAPYESIMTSDESELVKYAGNCFLYFKVLFMNVLYDAVVADGCNFEKIREALSHDPRIGASHTQPIHKSGHDKAVEGLPKRGAGGHCFIKDFEAFRRYYESVVGRDEAASMLDTMVCYNNHLLRSTEKDLDLLASVYGEEVVGEVTYSRDTLYVI